MVGIGLAVRRADHTSSPLYHLSISSSPRLPCSTLACTIQQIMPWLAVRLARLLLVFVALVAYCDGGGARVDGREMMPYFRHRVSHTPFEVRGCLGKISFLFSWQLRGALILRALSRLAPFWTKPRARGPGNVAMLQRCVAVERRGGRARVQEEQRRGQPVVGGSRTPRRVEGGRATRWRGASATCSNRARGWSAQRAKAPRERRAGCWF